MSKNLIYIYCIAILFAVLGELCSADAEEIRCDDVFAIKQRILSRLSEINNYQFGATVSIDNNIANSRIYGKQPDRLKIIQKIKKGSEELTNTIVFDGQYQWSESKFIDKILQVSKIKLSEVVDSGRPFDTGYYMQGAGIFGGEDYPSTVRILLSVYNLSATCFSHRVMLYGDLNKEKFEEYAGKRKFAKLNKEHGFRDRFITEFKYAILQIGSTDNLLNEYSLGPSKKTLKLNMKLRDLSINSEDLDGVFEFESPRGVDPTDITNELIQALSAE